MIMAGMVEIDENEFQLEIIFLAESLGIFIDLGRCPVKFPSKNSQSWSKLKAAGCHLYVEPPSRLEHG